MVNSRQHHVAAKAAKAAIASLLLLLASISHADELSWTAPEQIESVAYDYVVAAIKQQEKNISRFEVQVTRLDRRLKLPPCEDPPMAESKRSSRFIGSIVLQVSCQKPGWRIHVPVIVRLFREVLVAAERLSRNTLLSTSHVMLSERDLSRIRPNFLHSSADAVGKSLRRSVSQGTVITQGMLQEQELIKRGDSVIIVATKKGLSVRMPGVALMSGTLGNQIKVRNVHSRRIVKGWITAAGEIRVPM